MNWRKGLHIMVEVLTPWRFDKRPDCRIYVTASHNQGTQCFTSGARPPIRGQLFSFAPVAP